MPAGDMITVKQFTFNPVGENTYVLSAPCGACAVVDPGCLSREEREELYAYIDGGGLRPQAIWLTHLHFDHVWGAAETKRRYGIDIYASGADAPWMAENSHVCARWGLPAPEEFTIDHEIDGGTTLAIGEAAADVIGTPGHSPGGVSFHLPADGICLTGDTLFCESVGRTDLMGGDSSLLLSSVRRALLRLPAETRILPGHGPSTTVGHERLCNPYMGE